MLAGSSVACHVAAAELGLPGSNFLAGIGGRSGSPSVAVKGSVHMHADLLLKNVTILTMDPDLPIGNRRRRRRRPDRLGRRDRGCAPAAERSYNGS